jgi:hypothetical protein
VTPSKGVELKTTFFLSAANWEDSNLPLQYMFGYVNPISSKVVFLSPMGFSTFSSTYLVAGSATADGKLNCFVSVFNSLTANTTVYESVVVTKTAMSASNISANLIYFQR